MTDVNTNSIQQKLDNLRSFLQKPSIKNETSNSAIENIFSGLWLLLEGVVGFILIFGVLPDFGPEKLSIFYWGQQNFFYGLLALLAMELVTMVAMSGLLWLGACFVDYITNKFQSLDNRFSTEERRELSQLINDLNVVLKGNNNTQTGNLPKIDTTLSLNDLSANVEQVQQLVNSGQVRESVALSGASSVISSVQTVPIPSADNVHIPPLHASASNSNSPIS